MKQKILAGAGLAAALVVAGGAPAFAHVTTNPATAPKGAEITLGFRVPNEQTGVEVVKVDVVLPTDHPLLGVKIEPVPGWTSAATEIKLSPPVQSDDGPVAQAVSEIVWTAAAGGGTAPDQFQEFPVLVQRLPTDVNQVMFKVVQTYSDGTVVRWIDPVDSAHPNPDHPGPALALTAATAAGAGAGATTPTTAVPASAPGSPAATFDVSKLAASTSVNGARTLGMIGIVVGALGLVLAAVALTRRPRASGTGGAG